MARAEMGPLALRAQLPWLLLLLLLGCCLLRPVSAGVKGFGIIFSIEPEYGSTAGGTEVHIAGAGFAYATNVLINNKDCQIFEPSVKDGELTCYTPANPAGSHEVVVVFTSGHRAYLRGSKFRYWSRYTPTINFIGHASALVSNVTWKGDLKKTLEQNQREILEDTGEKRNATEIMHAYLGTGIEVFADKGGKDEFRCDLIETPNINHGICEVSARTHAGFYNFTYVLEDGDTGHGYGKASNDIYSKPYVNLQGQDYLVEIFPTIQNLLTQQVGRLGGATITLTSDALAPGKGNFAARHVVLLDGVPCAVQSVVQSGNYQAVRCLAGSTGLKPNTWPLRLAQGSWAQIWKSADRLGLSEENSGAVRPLMRREINILDQIELIHPGKYCGGTRRWLRQASSLEQCANNCFWMGTCKFFDFRQNIRECTWCQSTTTDGEDVSSPRNHGTRRRFSTESVGGIYKMLTTGKYYLEHNASVGPNWKLIDASGQRCAGSYHSISNRLGAYKLMGAGIQTCADVCASFRTEGVGGKCVYFGILGEATWSQDVKCVVYRVPAPDNTPKSKVTGGCATQEDTAWWRYWTIFELTKPIPHSPPPAGAYPGGRGVVVRGFNACPKGNAFNEACHSGTTPFQALYGTLNSEYAKQNPMYETIRTDVVRGAFGMEKPLFDNPADLERVDPEIPYETLHNATGEHGVVEEILGFFVAPFTAHYSFLTWGNTQQEVWLSTSRDPADTVLVAENFDYVRCRAGTKPRTQVGCRIWVDFDDINRRVYYGHHGTNISLSFNFSGDQTELRTPTVQTLALERGERRFFVKRVRQAEVFQADGNSRRRRRHIQATGVRVHSPDLSHLPQATRSSLTSKKCWPEILLFKKIITKKEGQWRFGIRGNAGDQLTYSSWMRWNFNEYDVTDALNKMVLPSGSEVVGEAFYLSTLRPGGDVLYIDQYTVTFWRPCGKVPRVVIEYDQMRSTVEVLVASHGSTEDLFLWPLSAAHFEVPVLEPSAQLSATGISARHNPRNTVLANGNSSNNSALEAAEEDENQSFPCPHGSFHENSCHSALGCQFGQTMAGTKIENTIDEGEVYGTWGECQQRCCHDIHCFAASWDTVSHICNKHTEFAYTADASATGLVSNIARRQASEDGYGYINARLYYEGIQVAGYPGHRSVTWCKAECSKNVLCNSFVYHETVGCFLRTQCVTEDSVREPSSEITGYKTWYKIRGTCQEPWELANATRNELLKPADPFGGTCSSLLNVFPGGKDRRRRTPFYNLTGLLNQAFEVITTTTTTTRPPGIGYFRRLLDPALEKPFAEFVHMHGSEEVATKTLYRHLSADAMLSNGSADELQNNESDGNESNGNESESDRSDLTSDGNESDGNESIVMTILPTTTATSTSTATSTGTSTSTTTTTLPPPPVRIAQKGGGYFNIGDALPSEGHVVGRVEVLYNNTWGTVCKDGFADTEAQVVCNELGLTNTWARAESSSTGGQPGDSAQNIWIDDIECTGSEDHLSLCTKSGWGVHNCWHSEDARLWCESQTTTVTVVTVTNTRPTTTSTTSFALLTVQPRDGFIRNRLSGLCITPETLSSGSALLARDCEFHSPNASQRWRVNTLGMIQSEADSSLCFKPDAPTPAPWRELDIVLSPCDHNVSADENTEQRWAFSDGGFIQSQWSGMCLDIQGDRSRKENGQTDDVWKMKWKACELTESLETTDQTWQFVETASSPPARGLLMRLSDRRCLDPKKQTLGLQMATCEYHNPETDMAWELQANGNLVNTRTKQCLSGSSPSSLQLQPCDVNVTSWDLNQSTGLLRANGGSDCLGNLQTSPCSEGDQSLTWIFSDVNVVAGKCCSICSSATHPSADVWYLDSNLQCSCQTLSTDIDMNNLWAGGQGSMRAVQNGRSGILTIPDFHSRTYPSTSRSLLADLFVAPTGGDQISGYTPETGSPQILPETGNLPTSPFGFSYLSEIQQPYVDRILVNGEILADVNMTEGDNISMDVRNFDGLSGSVVMHLGLVNSSAVSVSDATLEFIAPAATHGLLKLRVMAGWKGWADFAPMLGSKTQVPEVSIQFDDLNRVSSLSPAQGSMLGGTSITVLGMGFKLPAEENRVIIYASSGVEMGACNVTSAYLTSLECSLPRPDLSHWTSTQFEEVMTVNVNGQTSSTSGAHLTFTYSRPETPIVLSVEPRALSYAVTSNVTLIGYNFGLLKRETSVRFGNRTCRVWETNETVILCQLVRSAMAQPPLCSEVKDVYNTACIVKPFNFFARPRLLVTSKGYAEAQADSNLDMRFEIHSVSPAVGSEEGGCRVTVRGVGFGSPAVTSQRLIACLGSLGDIVSWTPSEIVFTSRKLRLNTDLIDVNTNLITAEHMCGPGNTKGPCKHGAFQLGFTPNVTAVSPTAGSAGDVLSIMVDLPPGYISQVTQQDVSLYLGTHLCNHSITSKSSNTLSVQCAVPAFEASTVDIRLNVKQLGNAKFPDSLATFTQNLVFTSITPNQGSIGGSTVVITGKGFAQNASRHFIRVGERDWGACDPVKSSYSSITCNVNYKHFDQDRQSDSQEDVEVTLWDVNIASDPMLAFGQSSTGCMRGHDTWRTYNCMSEAECALRCLSKANAGCKSFEFRPRYQHCFLSEKSFSSCSDCSNQGWLDCRYFERRTEKTASLAVSTKLSNAWSFKRSLTPNIEMVYAHTAGAPQQGLVGTATGCGADAADLGSGNDNCCSSGTCGVNEGKCSSNSQCASNLMCISYGCSWTSDTASNLKDSCCALRGSADGFSQQEKLWSPGDDIFVRVSSLGSTADVAAAKSNPGGGFVNVSFAGVQCPVESLAEFSGQSWVNVKCTLGDVPGGLTLLPFLEVSGRGYAMERDEWIFLPLNVSSASAVEDELASGSSPLGHSSLGGGWRLNVNGTGFSPPAGEGADTFVEVSVCGKPCEVVSGGYNFVECMVPNVTTPEVLTSNLPSLTLPAAKVISEGAGLASTLSPSCFYGIGDGHFEVNHPTCVAIFDGDPELVGGTSGGNCHLGLDFGEFTNARVEKIRFHPLYDARQSDKYVNSKFQVGSLSATQTCDELSYGWRGVEYRGCQDVSAKGRPCLRWDSWSNYVTANPELAGHNYCRNPTPQDKSAGIWCRTEKGDEYCGPKMPNISWTDVHTVSRTPKMLWNEVTLSTAASGRFVRFFSPFGNCQLTEIQVIGQMVAPSSECNVAVRNVRRSQAQNLNMDLKRVGWRGGVHSIAGFLEVHSPWATNNLAKITFSASITPTVTSIEPTNGTARGGTVVNVSGSNFGADWLAESVAMDNNDSTSAVTVEFNQYPCIVSQVTSKWLLCTTTPRNQGIRTPSFKVSVAGVGLALNSPGVRWRYLDRWSQLDTWASQEPPVEGALVSIPSGQAILLDEDTPQILMLSVEGELVFDNKDIHLQATYIWVKGGTLEIGTEAKPFLHRARITLHGDKYSTIRLPVIGGKCLAVSNTHFTYREFGDNAVEPGNIGTMDIHGKPRLKVWSRLAQTVQPGDRVIVLQDSVDWKPGEELMVAATEASHKHFSGNGLHGVPPVDFQNERVFVQSVAADMKTITLTAPLEFEHISTYYIRPIDGEYIDLSAEVALLSRNIKIEGDPTSELDSWGGHTMVAFGGIYRIENAEFYRMGQQGELSRYPVHFHITQDFGQYCYARYNSIHHSFQRAVAIHSTNYVMVKGNVGFDIVGHMFFVETGMEMHNRLEGNLGVGAIPLLSGMLESDQEPAAFWTAAMNNVWIDNVAVTGSDGWYFQLPKHPISHSMDVYSNSICPVGDRIGEWTRNRCHHTSGSCIRVYLTWVPTKDPCSKTSGENPQILFNTTCWGCGFACFSSMLQGSIHLNHVTSVESGKQDYVGVKFNRGGSMLRGKWPTDYQGIPHIKDSVFVGVLPHDLGKKHSHVSASIKLPQDEQFSVADSRWVNYETRPALRGCTKCWTTAKWRQGVKTYRVSGVSFDNTPRRIHVEKKDIYWDLDGSLTGTANSYSTWADAFNLGLDGCKTTKISFNESADGTASEITWFSDTDLVTEEPSIFFTTTGIYEHRIRNHSFITCTTPIRKLNIASPDPFIVHGRELTVRNQDTGMYDNMMFELLEVFGWAFPVVANQRLAVVPNFPGMEFQTAYVRYAHSDLLALKEKEALKNRQTVVPEWLQLQVDFVMDYDHVKLRSPAAKMVGERRGEDAGLQAETFEKEVPYITMPAQPPDTLAAMTHGMKGDKSWAMSFRFPLPEGAPSWEQEPLSAQFEARRCPDEGCISGLPSQDLNWTSYTLWSEKFGDASAVRGTAIDIEMEDWIMFDLADEVVLKNLTIKGKLSFDDSENRVLTSGVILVWGVLEIGTEASPFGKNTGKSATIQLSGQVSETDDYLYIEDNSFWNKVLGVVGTMETYGVPVTETWLKLATTLGRNDETACLLNTSFEPLDWPSGSLVSFAPTEFDNPAGDVVTKTLTQDAVWDDSCGGWRLHWSGSLGKTRFAGDVPIGNGNSVSLRGVVGRVDRSVVITSVDRDSNNYGGHLEIFDVKLQDLAQTTRVGKAALKYTRFHQLGKGALIAAVKVSYSSGFDPPPVNIFDGCSWTSSGEYALHLASGNVPVIVSNNVMVDSLNGGIFVMHGSSGAQIIKNAVIGVQMADTAPRVTLGTDEQLQVITYAGIRLDNQPVRMIGNIVAGSNDIGFMLQAEKCPPKAIFDNEAQAIMIGVFVHTQPKKQACQSVSLFTVWKAAHAGIYLADVQVSKTVISNVVIADSHMGILPYLTVSSAYRRMFVYNATLIGTSPAGTDCSNSLHCRTFTNDNPLYEACKSMYVNSDIRRVGFVTPIQTKNKKTCISGGDYYYCQLFSPAGPKPICWVPLEKDIHMQKGLGWVFFQDTTFAYWKSSDCGKTSRALAPNLWGAEVNFPASFTRSTWYESDQDARFDLSTDLFDDSYAARASPCKSTGGGCMGLDQLLFQDMDGTLTGTGVVSTVVPKTLRTELVWAPLCNTTLGGVDIGAMVCANVTVQLLEMVNLDRGAKDVKFGPLVLTPDSVEDNGFGGGVLSSVGPFYASCPCGWDFSFYHILIKPGTTYYMETMSLPENFKLRYWSPNPMDAINLEIFYPDSRGVNVFVGGASDPDMALKLAEKPTLASAHGAHVVSAQRNRLYMTLRGSPEGFNAQRDLIVRRTPTVKLKMNVEISMDDFNAAQFQTNLAILLGIPPERIVVAAVQTRRRLMLVDADSADAPQLWDAQNPTTCKSHGRRLTAVSAIGLDISIQPSTDAAAAASGGDASSQGGAALNAQAAELGQVSSTLSTLSTGDSLAAAAGGTVSVTEMQVPSEPDEAANEEVPSAAETAAVEVVDVKAQAAAQANVEVSASAPCPTTNGVTVTVGLTTGSVYPSAEMASGATASTTCSTVDSGYSGAIALSCNAGVLRATPSCSSQNCNNMPVKITIGNANATVNAPASLASGMTSSMSCSAVNAAYSGEFSISCSLGALSYTVSSCSPGCLTSQAANVTVAGNTVSWSPSSNMQSGTTSTIDCQPINNGYSGTITMSCFFGVLSADPSNCAPKACSIGDQVSVTLDGITQAITLTTAIQSGLSGTERCAAVNPSWGELFTMSCNLGVLSSDVTACRKACPASLTMSVALGGTSTSISPGATLASGATEYNRLCSGLNSGYEGVYSITCQTGALSASTGECTPRGCSATDTASVTVGTSTTALAAGLNMHHEVSARQACGSVNGQYTGTFTMTCSLGQLSVASTASCVVKPCEPWHFVAATLHGASGLVYPRAQILSGNQGIGECSGANVEYSGDMGLQCVNGAIVQGDSIGCLLTCTAARSSTTMTIDNRNYNVVPGDRIAHGATGTQNCSNAAYGFTGTVQLSCDNGTISLQSHDCLPENCTAGLTVGATVHGASGNATLLENTSHGATGNALCASVNAGTSGNISVSCYARNLTVASTSNCKKSCDSSATVGIQLDSHSHSVAPASAIQHGATTRQTCNAINSGYIGVVDLTCNDGVTSVSRNACYPGPCARTDLNTSELDSGDNYTVDCSAVSPLLVGDVVVSCYAGVLSSNSSGCKGHCNASQSDSTKLHGQVEQLSCTAIDSSFDGSANGTCLNGVMSIDSSTCVPACTAGQTVVVSVASVSHTVALQSRVSSGSSEQQMCGSIDAAYHGSLGLACSSGVIIANNSCHKKCLSSASVQVTMGGLSYTLSPSADIEHSQSGQVSCSAGIAGYSGSISLSCAEGVLTADGTGCLAYCAIGTFASVTFSGLTRSLATLTQISHGSTETMACSVAEPGFNGSLILSCSNGQVSMQSQSCFESPCAQSYHVQLDGSASVLQLEAQVNHGESVSEECGAANMAYGGNITSTCIKGSMIPNYAACAPACLMSHQIPLVVGSYQLMASPASRMANGTSVQRQCSNINADLEGSLTLRCVMGSLSLSSGCVPSCLTSAQANFTVGSYSVSASPNSRMADGSSEQRQCASVNADLEGSFTLRCQSGSLTVDSTCVSSCLTSAQASFTVGTHNVVANPRMRMANGASEQEQCAASNANLSGTFLLRCESGSLIAESACAASCLTSYQAPLVVNPYTLSVSPQSTMLNGSITQKRCADLNLGLEGNFTLGCVEGSLTIDSRCEASCLTSFQTSFAVGPYNVVASPSSRMAPGSSLQKLCSDLNVALEGNFTLRCQSGALIVDSACKASCLASGQVPFTVGIHKLTVSPDARMADGSSYQKQCSAMNELFDGNLTLRCDRGSLTVDSRCTSACPANVTVFAPLDGGQWPVVTGAAMIHSSTKVLACPANFAGSLTMQCINGETSVQSHSCVPLSCAAGTMADLNIGVGSRGYNVSKSMSHRDTADINCSHVNESYEGSIVLECKYGVLSISSFHCAGLPCQASPGLNVTVGWVTSPVVTPRIEHSANHTYDCASINSEFLGAMQVRCDGGNLLGDTSSCAQIEVGCLPTGRGFSVRLADSTYLLHPISPVAAGDSWEVDCGSIRPGWVGTLNATCGSLGSITADDLVCMPKSCSAGQGINVTLGALRGVARLSSILAHSQMASVPCSSVDEGMRGNLQLSCNLGQILDPNLSNCAIVCLGARPVQATFGGVTYMASPPNDIADGRGLWMPCQDIVGNHSGDALLECKGGRVDVDASRCMPLPCASETRQISVGGYRFQIVLNGSQLGGQSPAASGFSVTQGCEVFSSNLAGTFNVTCLAGTFNFEASCTLGQCPAPGRASSSRSSLSTTDESGRLILNPRFVHDCGASKVTGQTCNVSCGTGWQGSSQTFRCWLGAFGGSLPNCTLIPVKVEVKGSTRLQVKNPVAFVRDPLAKAGIEKQIAGTSGVNESAVTATLSLDTGSTSASGGRRLATAVRVDYVIVQQVQAASPREATSLAANLGSQITASLEQTSDEDMAAAITQAIAEVAQERNVAPVVYEVQVLERTVQPIEIFAGETSVPMENITSFTINSTTTSPNPPSALGDSDDEKQANLPLVIGLSVGLLVTAGLGLILGAYCARAAVRNQIRIQDDYGLRQSANQASGLPPLEEIRGSSPHQPRIAFG